MPVSARQIPNNNNVGGGEIMIADEEFVSPVWNIEELKNEESDEAD
jgi:hypothetical protein